jgi:hypothetical protein
LWLRTLRVESGIRVDMEYVGNYVVVGPLGGDIEGSQKYFQCWPRWLTTWAQYRALTEPSASAPGLLVLECIVF